VSTAADIVAPTGALSYVSKFASAAGAETHYIEAGKGPLVILIHGGGAGADAVGNWGSLIPLLSNDHRVIAVDMVGFGQSAKPVADDVIYTQAGRNVWLASFIESVSGGSAVTLVGNSMGGATALGTAIARPDLVARLVLMGSAGLKISRPPSDALRTIMEYDYTYQGMERLIGALTGKGFPIQEQVVRYRHELVNRPENREGLANVQKHTRATGGMVYDDGQIAGVKVPTLLIWGKEDQVIPVEDCFRFLQLIDRSWAYVIPGCGHWPMIEKAPAFVGALRAFESQVAGEDC
jgi:2-hydroxy-6-oxo-6-(2'-aminophenyl)hexa-2,4-dienoate hydrolase